MGLSVIPRDWEARSGSLENPQTPLSFPAEWLLDIFNGGRTDSGIRVSEMTAFQTSTFLSCVDLISGKISSLPRSVKEISFLKTNSREIQKNAYDNDYYDLIATEPNPEMNGNVFFKAFLCHCLAWGNGYSEIQRDASGAAVALWPRNPSKTRPYRLLTDMWLDPVPWRPFGVALTAGTLVFKTTDAMDDEDRSENNAQSRAHRFIRMEDMIHVPGLSFDGRIGQTVVWLARQTIGMALATEKFGAKYFANFARPGGILMMPMNLSPDEKEQAKRSWRESQGGENAHQVAVLPPGFDWKDTSNNPQQAQTIETRSFVRNEICSIFHIPTHMAGADTKGKASTEQLAQELKEYALDPWISGLKIELKRKLFPHRGIGRTPRNLFFVDFDPSALLRPDAATREKFNASGKQWGTMNTNDVRQLEGQNPIDQPWAEEYWMPINMTLTTTPVDPTFQDGAGNGVVPPGGTGGSAAKAKPKDVYNLAYGRLFEAAFKRVATRDNRDMHFFRGSFSPVLYAIRDMVQMEAAQEIRIQSRFEFKETDMFMGTYITEMYRRCLNWKPDAIETAGLELDKAVRAIRVVIYREMAAVKAQEETSADLEARAEEQLLVE